MTTESVSLPRHFLKAERISHSWTWLIGRIDIRLTCVHALLALCSLLAHCNLVHAEQVYEWRTGDYLFEPYANQVCGLRPSGCQQYAEGWFKKYYPPQSYMFNVVYHFDLLDESGSPTFDTQAGGFTLGISYDADYIGTCCGYQGQLLHYRYPNSDPTSTQHWYFWTYAKVWQAQFYVMAKNPESQCDSCDKNSVAHPINPATGAVFDTSIDISVPAFSSFKRFYNSIDSGGFDGSGGWRHTFSRQVSATNSSLTVKPYAANAAVSSQYADVASACTSGFAEIQSQVPQWSGAVTSYTNGNCQLTKGGVSIGSLTVYSTSNGVTPASQPVAYDIIRDDGNLIRFTVINGVITAPPGTSLQLVRTATGFTVADAADNVEQYDASGKLLSITSRSGVVQSMAYDSSGRLSGVNDNLGHQLILGYDTQNRLISVTRQ